MKRIICTVLIAATALSIYGFLIHGIMETFGALAGDPLGLICLLGYTTLPFLLFWGYFAFILVLTLLSRESGSADKPIDLVLFSTLKINRRNNAYAVENILLFIPFGLFGAWNSQKKRILATTFWGGLFSLTIETLQLITARGFFQLDDIITNMLGAFLGAVLYRVLFGGYRLLHRM